VGLEEQESTPALLHLLRKYVSQSNNGSLYFTHRSVNALVTYYSIPYTETLQINMQNSVQEQIKRGANKNQKIAHVYSLLFTRYI